MYLAMKVVHILAVIIFLGNIATGVFWKAHADRTNDPRIIAHVMDGIIRSDQLFTIPGVVLILVAGFGAAGIGRMPILGTDWILWSIILFSISGIAFMAQIAPLQRKMRDIARAATSAADFDKATYKSLSKKWGLWGVIALVTPLIAVVLMVLKPDR
jgi:uncharacterized membrane protein